MANKKRLIVFFIPSEKIVNGGILSIFSIAKVSREFKKIHGAEVVLSMYPGVKSYGHNDLFKNDEKIYEFEQLMQAGPYEFLQLQVPEMASYNLTQSLKKYKKTLKDIADFRVNILLQNILLLQPPIEVANWFPYTTKVTYTTAHNKYSTQELADAYAIPVHHLSTFVDETQYEKKSFQEKENLIVLSHDPGEMKQHITTLLTKNFPEYSIVTIKKMPYEEYKELMSRARFTITFGEGFDGYYVEGFFTDGITFAVYNKEFFPSKSFGALPNTYTDFKDMQKHIVQDMKRLSSNEKQYAQVVKSNLKEINRLYNFRQYTQNVKNFYLGNFTYMPAPKSGLMVAGEIVESLDQIVAQKESMIKERDTAITNMEKMIADKSRHIEALDQKIHDLESSLSWRVTKPLRKTSAVVKRKSR